MAPPKGRPGAGKEGKQRGKFVKRQSDVDELRCGEKIGAGCRGCGKGVSYFWLDRERNDAEASGRR